MTTTHSNLTGASAVHPAAYGPQTSDPGAVGANKLWIDSTATPYQIKVRNTGNTGWVACGQGTSSATFSGEVVATDFSATGLTGAVTPSRHVGATAGGAPVSGTFIAGDTIVDTQGQAWICTIGGTPGTWIQVGSIISGGLNGQTLSILSLTELLTIAAAATSTTTLSIPAGAIVLAVSVRVTVAIPTAATFTVIGNTSTTVFNTAAVTVALNSTDRGTAAGAFYNATAQTVRITPNLTPGTNVGRVRVTVMYIQSTPPTS